jgi:hypothetical protein
VPEARPLAELELEASNAQIEFCDPDATGDDVPDWDGHSPVAATARFIGVMTKPDVEGPVHITVWADAAENCGGELVYDGTLALEGGFAEVGSSLTSPARLERLRLGRGEHSIQVYVDKPGYAERIDFNVGPVR